MGTIKRLIEVATPFLENHDPQIARNDRVIHSVLRGGIDINVVGLACNGFIGTRPLFTRVITANPTGENRERGTVIDPRNFEFGRKGKAKNSEAILSRIICC